MVRLPVFFLAAAAFIATSVDLASAQFFQPPRLGSAMRSAGRQIYMDHCAACHASGPQTSATEGPTLVGIVGRPAASVPGYRYSEALKKSGIVWTEDNLRKWLADNAHMVPGTLMPHVSITDPAEQLYVIEFLKTLNGSPRGR